MTAAIITYEYRDILIPSFGLVALFIVMKSMVSKQKKGKGTTKQTKLQPVVWIWNSKR